MRLWPRWGCAGALMGFALSGLVTAQAAPARAPWSQFRHAFVETEFQQNPSLAVWEGRHDLDGRLPDWSGPGLAARAAFLRSSIASAQAYGDKELSGPERFERDYLLAVACGDLFWLSDADQPHNNPAFYFNPGLDPSVYALHDYAPAPVRMKAMIAYLRRIPAAAEQIRANLRGPLPASFIDYGVSGFGGLAGFYKSDGKAAFASVHDEALQHAYDEAAAPAAKAMAELANTLKAQRPHATQDFALGSARFARMLRETEMVDIPLGRLDAIGRADLARNTAALVAACARFAPGASLRACIDKETADKPAEGPVAAAARQVSELRAFVRAHDLVSLGGDREVVVRQTPRYNSQSGAYLDAAGALDRDASSIYYVAAPDRSWPKHKQLAYLPSRARLLFTSVHEVMPGHAVQLQHAARAPSEIGRLFLDYGFLEGWAHYSEQMMWDAGLKAGDEDYHVGQLTEALLRDVRFLSAIGLHTGRMTQEQSRRMFVEQAFQDEGDAEQQAARGTYDPGYLVYTLGKLMILRMRDDWTPSHGGRSGWKTFHDTLLSYGTPPLPLVRKQMGLSGPAL